MRLRHERGFSLIELLIVITLMSIVFGITVPIYRRYVAQTELRNVSQDLYLKLVTAHNNAINGVVPKSVSGSTQRYYWVVNVQKVGSAWEYNAGACQLQTLPANPTSAQLALYNNQFSFSFCGTEDYKNSKFPARFSIVHPYSASNPEVSIYFEPITGQVSIYDVSGTRLDNPSDSTKNAIDIDISSNEYSAMSVTFHVNHQGTISQGTD